MPPWSLLEHVWPTTGKHLSTSEKEDDVCILLPARPAGHNITKSTATAHRREKRQKGSEADPTRIKSFSSNKPSSGSCMVADQVAEV